MTYEIFHFSQLPSPNVINQRVLNVYGNLNDISHLIYLPDTDHYIYDFKIVAKEFADGQVMFNNLLSVSIYIDHELLVTFNTPSKTYREGYHIVCELDMFYPILNMYRHKVSLRLDFNDRIEQKYTIIYKTANTNDWYSLCRMQRNTVKLIWNNSSFTYRANNLFN